MTERIEFIVPLTYMVMLLMAYYGPNADILGNVKLKHRWARGGCVGVCTPP